MQMNFQYTRKIHILQGDCITIYGRFIGLSVFEKLRNHLIERLKIVFKLIIN